MGSSSSLVFFYFIKHCVSCMETKRVTHESERQRTRFRIGAELGLSQVLFQCFSSISNHEQIIS